MYRYADRDLDRDPASRCGDLLYYIIMIPVNVSLLLWPRSPYCSLAIYSAIYFNIPELEYCIPSLRYPLGHFMVRSARCAFPRSDSLSDYNRVIVPICAG